MGLTVNGIVGPVNVVTLIVAFTSASVALRNNGRCVSASSTGAPTIAVSLTTPTNSERMKTGALSPTSCTSITNIVVLLSCGVPLSTAVMVRVYDDCCSRSIAPATVTMPVVGLIAKAPLTFPLVMLYEIIAFGRLSASVAVTKATKTPGEEPSSTVPV